jgi:hypothetical protein
MKYNIHELFKELALNGNVDKHIRMEMVGVAVTVWICIP